MSMTIKEAIQQSNLPQLDAELLLANTLQKDRSWLIAHDTDTLPTEQVMLFTEQVNRRRAGEPVAYIIGQKEFFGRTFSVNSSVLIPRPCTEELIYATQKTLGNKLPQVRHYEIDTEISCWLHVWKVVPKNCTLVDIGCGSGAIACTLALECEANPIIATDISSSALVVAKINADMLGVRNKIDFYSGDLLEPLADLKTPFLVVSNPPYIPQSGFVETNVHKYEPNIALFSGVSGTDCLYALCTQAKQHPYCCGFIIECRTDQIKE